MKLLFIYTFVLFMVGFSKISNGADGNAISSVASSSYTVVSVSDLKWQKLNPARGENGPQAGILWGNLKGEVPTGFLAKFVDGFSSPPHIHNATYRAVVITGLIHNDDPDAANMWMPAGSFWTQPKGEVHITSARGSSNIALVEIDKGPYLVLPPEDSFQSDERPVNIDASNIVWVTPAGMCRSPGYPEIAYLWGKLEGGQSNGTFVKFPAGFEGKIHSHGSTFRAVVIEGRISYSGSDKILEPGSYFSSDGEFVHQITSGQSEQTIIYIRTNSPYQLSVDG